jgi:hypothetical protein
MLKKVIGNLIFTVAIVSTARAGVRAAQLSYYTQALQYLKSEICCEKKQSLPL